MQGASTKGVLSQLGLLEVQARSRRAQPQQQQSHVKELKVKVEQLILQRDQLRAEIQAHQNLQKLRMSLDKPCAREEDEEMDDDSEDSQLLQLMARHTQLRDLLHAHHLVGGYDIVKTSQGKGVCVSLATAYEGTYLETYNLEIDLKPTLRISRHNIPPFILLNDIAEQSHMQTDIKAFLNTLSQHLNAFSSRKQQLKLVKELFHKSVEVLESNVLCSILVLMVTVPRENTAVLCKLDYMDHTRCLPTRVSFECEDEKLPDSPQWKKNCSLLMETPVHKALITMKEMGNIA
ncbi:centromere protein O [Scomber japonicus]|uniref:centromere protein O n=1 Tax=Scomber japonicus TaxID=13676 RepID=UPI0023059BD4|nr:centromere protein O [Scomber japonicus]